MADANTQIVLPRSLATKAKAATPGSGTKSGEKIPRPNQTMVFRTVEQLRALGRKTEAIRILARDDGIFSSAVYSMVQTANSGYRFKAYNSTTHLYDPQATELVRSIVGNMNSLSDYTEGFSDKSTLDTVVEMGLREVVLTGAMAAELVLDKVRLPSKINVVPYESLEYKKKAIGKYPVQTSGSGEIDLNIPTFWISESHRDANRAYASSMMEGALGEIMAYSEFISDMKRALRRAGHTRIIATLDEEKIRAGSPPEIQSDPAKLRDFLENTRQEIVDVINSLSPEDALVTFSLAEFSTVSAEGEKSDYTSLLTTLAGQLATSLKTPPSVLGLRLAGSQSLSNSETLVYLLTARSIQMPVEQVLSRALTLAVRLYGSDSRVVCEFNDIDIRPAGELAAFSLMEQSRILEQLSIGMLSDETAAEKLGAAPIPPGAPPLSGTFFNDSGSSSSMAEKASPNTDAMGAALTSKQPTNGGGSDN